MSILINISGTPVAIPSSGESPNWAPAVDEALQLLAQAVNATIGTYDVTPQKFVIDAQNPGTNVTIPNLSFPTSAVRAAFIRYSVYRNTSSTTVVEAGDILVAYNPTNPPGNLWEISQSREGSASITFAISDAGNMTFSTTTLAGTGHNGSIFYAAQAMLI